MGKRQRDVSKAEKKREKEDRRRRKRLEGPAEVELVTAEAMTGVLPSIEQAMAYIPVSNPGSEQSRAAAPIPCRLFVGGLSWDTTGDTLKAHFESHGQVSSAVVVHDRDTGQSRGFGFVEMQDRKDAAKAVSALNGSDLEGRSIVVNVATERRR